MPEKQRRKAKLNMILFQIADIYYCHVETHKTNNGLIKPKPLMKREKWLELKQKILTDMKLKNETNQEIGFALMSATLDIFKDAALEIALEITFEGVVMILL